ncbi:hypothetical protein SEA_XIANYUE_89 [Mycobacterium phage XianYue]|nr:hypothetical protein SEA_XIANYUE_89 [Mycobacterium phage XianYue]
MYELTVTKVGGESITIKASHRQPLLDHLEASAGRHNVELRSLAPRQQYGELKVRGQIVGEWEVTVE